MVPSHPYRASVLLALLVTGANHPLRDHSRSPRLALFQRNDGHIQLLEDPGRGSSTLIRHSPTNDPRNGSLVGGLVLETGWKADGGGGLGGSEVDLLFKAEHGVVEVIPKELRSSI